MTINGWALRETPSDPALCRGSGCAHCIGVEGGFPISACWDCGWSRFRPASVHRLLHAVVRPQQRDITGPFAGTWQSPRETDTRRIARPGLPPGSPPCVRSFPGFFVVCPRSFPGLFVAFALSFFVVVLLSFLVVGRFFVVVPCSFLVVWRFFVVVPCLFLVYTVLGCIPRLFRAPQLQSILYFQTAVNGFVLKTRIWGIKTRNQIQRDTKDASKWQLRLNHQGGKIGQKSRKCNPAGKVLKLPKYSCYRRTFVERVLRCL
jgi:hypothetical protein